MEIYLAAEIFLLFAKLSCFLRDCLLERKNTFFLLTGRGYSKVQGYISTSNYFKKKTELQVMFSNVEHDPETIELIFKDTIMPLKCNFKSVCHKEERTRNR